MFTGLVEELGFFVRREQKRGGARIVVHCAMGPLQLGESISVDGVCLTVDRIGDGHFEVDASPETLRCTTLGELKPGDAINLERAMVLGGRMGGHIVSGHVDAVGALATRSANASNDGSVELEFGYPIELAPFIATKGSIAVSGVSLTVNRVEAEKFAVMIIPHTRARTTLDRLTVGAKVNLEVDVLARYAERILTAGGREASSGSASSNAAWLERLKRSGYR